MTIEQLSSRLVSPLYLQTFYIVLQHILAPCVFMFTQWRNISKIKRSTHEQYINYTTACSV